MAAEGDNRIRILVLGENRVGKSSIIDLLIRRDEEELSWQLVEPRYGNTYTEPKTFSSDKYVLTEARGLETYYLREKKRKEGQRTYMERIKDQGFNIVLVVFNASRYELTDPNVLRVYKMMFPEFADIMHVVFTGWEVQEEGEERIESIAGHKDVARLRMPPYDYSGHTPEGVAKFKAIRMETLAYLEQFIADRASPDLHKLSLEVGKEVKVEIAKKLGYDKPLTYFPWFACFTVLGLFIFLAKRFG